MGPVRTLSQSSATSLLLDWSDSEPLHPESAPTRWSSIFRRTSWALVTMMVSLPSAIVSEPVSAALEAESVAAADALAVVAGRVARANANVRPPRVGAAASEQPARRRREPARAGYVTSVRANFALIDIACSLWTGGIELLRHRPKARGIPTGAFPKSRPVNEMAG